MWSKVICPHCLEKVSGVESKLEGAKDVAIGDRTTQWYKCPYCGERFIMESTVAISLETHPPSSMEYVDQIIDEIRAEIQSRPGKPNLGKQGCLRRVMRLRDIMKKERKFYELRKSHGASI